MIACNMTALRKVLYSFLLVACLGSYESSNASGQTVNETVQTVEKHYREVKDMTAEVTQKNLLKTIDQTRVFQGTLRIKKPGKLRLDYTNGQVILVNGREALFYSRKSEQVIKRTFTDFENMNIPVAFLLGAGHIRDDFAVSLADPKNRRKLELIPKKKGAAMQKLVLVSDESGRITDLAIFDRSGNVTEIEFKDIREDSGVDDSVFRFEVPKGTEIIEQ